MDNYNRIWFVVKKIATKKWKMRMEKSDPAEL